MFVRLPIVILLLAHTLAVAGQPLDSRAGREAAVGGVPGCRNRHDALAQGLAGDDAAATEIVSSPVIDGDRVFLVPARSGQEEGLTVVCPNTEETGAVQWRAPAAVWAAGRKGGSGIASPTYQVIDGIGQIVMSVYSSPVNEIWGLNALTGELFWQYGANAHNGMIPSAVADGSRVFLSDGLPPFSACLQMYVREGRIKARQAYHDDRNQCNQYNTVAIAGGCVFGLSNGSMQCTRLADGSLLWEQEDADWS